MSVRYLVTKKEWELLNFLYENRRNRENFCNATKEYHWDMEQEEASLSLEKKGFLYEKEGNLYMEKMIMVLLDVIHRSKEKINIGEHILFFREDIVIWLEKDLRSLNGYKLTPYPNITRWYEEEYEDIYPEPEQTVREQLARWMGRR